MKLLKLNPAVVCVPIYVDCFEVLVESVVFESALELIVHSELFARNKQEMFLFRWIIILYFIHLSNLLHSFALPTFTYRLTTSIIKASDIKIIGNIGQIKQFLLVHGIEKVLLPLIS